MHLQCYIWYSKYSTVAPEYIEYSNSECISTKIFLPCSLPSVGHRFSACVRCSSSLGYFSYSRQHRCLAVSPESQEVLSSLSGDKQRDWVGVRRMMWPLVTDRERHRDSTHALYSFYLPLLFIVRGPSCDSSWCARSM